MRFSTYATRYPQYTGLHKVHQDADMYIAEFNVTRPVPLPDEIKRRIDESCEEKERRKANERLRQYRRENLFLRLYGLPVEVAERLAEDVWEVATPWFDHNYHRGNKYELVSVQQ